MVFLIGASLQADNEKYPGPDEKVKISSKAVRFKNILPEYPPEVKKQKIEGDVWVKALVNKAGSVVGALIHKSSGNDLLDKSAVYAAFGCKYRPATFEDNPVATWVKYMVVFELPDEPPPSPKPTGGKFPRSDEYNSVEKIAEMIHSENPTYPREAKEKGVQGVVWIKALVVIDGSVKDAIVYKSSGSKLLDEAALDAARKYKYKPAIQDGQPVAMWVAYKVDFALSK